MPQIVPIKDLRDTTKISNLCHETNEPVFVTKNGYGDLAILSMENYESLVNRLRIYDEMLKGIQQADEGNLIDGKKALATLKNKYGSNL